MIQRMATIPPIVLNEDYARAVVDGRQAATDEEIRRCAKWLRDNAK
jgi:hypothetical protein